MLDDTPPGSKQCWPLLCRVARESKDPDLDIPMNAAPKSDPAIPETLSKYFSLDKDFNPVGVNNILSFIFIISA